MMKQRIGILGSGNVGQVLANGLYSLGFQVSIGSRAGGLVENWDGSVGTFADVASRAQTVILAVKGLAAESLVTSLQHELSGKTVIDTTNPIASTPPKDGVLHYFTSLNESLMERLQGAAPKAHFVKAFNSVGSANMVQPKFGNEKPTMFICGDDDSARQEVTELLLKLGWETEDMGTKTSARAIEPLCMLWCIPGILRHDWSHAFKYLKA